MIPYQTKTRKLSGSSYKEIHSKALIVFKKIKAKTKRRPYVRSAYFKKQKIFLIISGSIYGRNPGRRGIKD